MQPTQQPLTFDTQGNLILGGIHAPNGSWAINSGGDATFNTVGANAMTVGGVDVGQQLMAMSFGTVAYSIIASGTDTAGIGTGETTVFRGNAGSAMMAGRFYQITCKGHLQYSLSTGSADVIIRYSVDGSLPNSASLLLTKQRLPTGSGSVDFNITKYYSPSQDYDQWRFAITLQMANSNGTCSIYQGTLERGLEFAINDLGLYSTVVNGALAQTSKASGTPDPNPTTQYTKTYGCLDSASFQGDGTNRSGFDSGRMYQGQYSSTNGNQFSLATFDYAKIQSDTAGSTINKTEVYLNNDFFYNNSGGIAVIGDHSFATVTGNANYANVNPNISQSSFNWGQAKWVTVSNTIGQHLRDNVAKGIALGKGPSTSKTYYGYFAGHGQSGAPQLRITYTK